MNGTDQPDGAGDFIGRRIVRHPDRWEDTYALLYKLKMYRTTAKRASDLLDAMHDADAERYYALEAIEEIDVSPRRERQLNAIVLDAEARLDALAADAVALARGE